MKKGISAAIEHLRDSFLIPLAYKRGKSIVITGSTGVGKTTLISKAFGVTDVFPVGEDGTFESTMQPMSVMGKMNSDYLVLMDTPGDPGARDLLMEQTITGVIDGRQLQGIINVVACGYAHQAGTPPPTFDNDYLTQGVEEDSNFLDELFQNVAKVPDDIWFLTVANKSDKHSGGHIPLYGRGSPYDAKLRSYLNASTIELVQSTCVGDGEFSEIADELGRLTND
ncbi:MAG: hypothetical protein AAF666_17785 [Pseudomonadota bacterium]